MGAFYQTSPTNNIDFMYQLPKELMMMGIQNADNQNDILNEKLALFDDKATTVPYLPQDKDRVQQKAKDYQDAVRQQAQVLKDNPQDWRKQMSNIRDLGRQLQTDLTTGELSSIQSNHAAYQNWLSNETKRLDKGDITADWLNTAQSKYLSDFKGTNYNPTLKTGNVLRPEVIAKHVDINKKFDDYLKEVKANTVEESKVSSSGAYMYKMKGSHEWVGEERLQQIAADKFTADDETKAFLRQGAKLGVLDPLKTLSSAMSGAVSTYAFDKIKKDLDVDPNQVWIHNDSESQQNARQANSQAHESQMIDKRAAIESQQRADKQAYDAAQAERDAKMKHNLGLNPNVVPVESSTNSVNIGTGKVGATNKVNSALGTSTSTLQIFDKGELSPDYLRTQILPNANTRLAGIDSKIAEAQAKGDNTLVQQLNMEKQIYTSQKNTAEGLVNQAYGAYYKSKDYIQLDPKLQKYVKGYNDFLSSHNIADSKQARLTFGQTLGIPVTEGYTMPGSQLDGKRGVMGVRNPLQDFSKAVDASKAFIDKHTENNEVGNRYDAKGVDINLADPTINGLLNQAFNSGNISIYGANTLGGTKISGETRGLNTGMKIDDGNMVFGWNKDVQFSIPELMKATGATTPTELFQKVTVMPSTNGNIRLKVKLADIAPDKKTIGNSSFNYHQIEGLPDTKEVTFEIQGSSANQQIMQKLSGDTNPEVSKLAYIMQDPDNANFLNKFSGTVRPQSGGHDWGVPSKFGYGPATYEISKAADGRVKAVVTINGKTTEQTWNNDHEAEIDLIDLHTNLNKDPNGTYEQMIKAGVLK